MRWLAIIRNVLRSLFLRRQAENDLEDEFRDHLEREIESNIRAGMRTEDARLAALRLIGPISLHQEECRDWRGTAFLETGARDLRYGLQMLRRTPLFSLAATLTLALGIGANTTVFTFVENIVLRHAPVRAPEELAFLNWGDDINLSYPNYIDFRDRNRVFSELIACRYQPVTMSIKARENYFVWGYDATGNYFEALGIKPLLGRFFGPTEDDKMGANPVVVISHRLWQSHFAGDPGVVGNRVKINGFPFTIIGVAPAIFRGTELIVAADFWVPMSMELEIEPGHDFLRSRYSSTVWTLGRLKPNVARGQAEANLNQIAQEIASRYPNLFDPKVRFRLSPPGLIGESFRRPITAFGLVLMSIVGVVLLLVCINLAGMLVARGADRRREIGIRLALGASKGRLLLQLMTESLLLAVSGGLAGIGIAFVACRFLSSLQLNIDIPFETSLRPDALVLCFTIAASLSTSLLFGLTPALQAIRMDLIPSLKDAPVNRFRRWSARDLIVIAQIGLSVILVICSLLMVRSLQRALTLNLGFEPTNAVAASFDLSLGGYDVKRGLSFDANLIAKAAALPGFQSVGIINNFPLRIAEDNSIVLRTDRPVPKPSERRFAIEYSISPGYLQAAGTRLLLGRDINSHDRDGAPPVAIVNQALADLLFPKENPLGRRFRMSPSAADRGMEIIGVVETGKYSSIGEDPKPAVFLPIEQTGRREATLVVRTALSTTQAVELLRKTILDLDPELTLFNVGSLKDKLALPLFPARAAAIVLGVFGFLAIILAATGLFALVAYAVRRRAREIGIRMALGGRPIHVLSSILRRTLALCIIGVAIGAFVTLGASRLLSAVLYGVSPRDPVAYGTAILLMTFVALLACWSPATRAVQIDPARTLRED
jgi:predicted permease